MSQKNHMMDPKIYNNILKEVNLNSISLESSSARLKHENLDKGMNINVTETVSHRTTNQDKILQIRCKYTLLGVSEEKIETQSKNYAIKIVVVYKLRYTYKKSLPKEFIEIFKQRNVPINSWPYFREFVQNTMQRMNIPPITLPFIHS